MIPYESGSIMHEGVKAEREIARNLESALGEPRKRRRK